MRTKASIFPVYTPNVLIDCLASFLFLNVFFWKIEQIYLFGEWRIESFEVIAQLKHQVIGESNIGKVLFDLLFARLALESSFFDAFDRLFVVVPPIKRFLYQMAEIELAALPLPLVADF